MRRDGERLPPAGRARVDTIRAALVSRGPRVRVLNDPRHQLRRRELLAALCARGTNRFKAYGIDVRTRGKRTNEILEILLPLLRGGKAEAEPVRFDRAVYRDQLQELDRDVARGLLNETYLDNAD